MSAGKVPFGILLAGGESRRMGRPKEGLLIAGETMLARTARTLSEVADRILIVGSPERVDREKLIGSEWLVDRVAYQGPLVGLMTGLEAIATEATFEEWSLVVPCDHPGLSRAFLARLIRCQSVNTDAVIVESGGIWHPFPGLYRVKLAKEAKSISAEPGRGLKHLLQEVKTRVLSADAFGDIDPDLLNLASVDTPGAWERLMQGE